MAAISSSSSHPILSPEPENSPVTEWSHTKSIEITFLPNNQIERVTIDEGMNLENFLFKICSIFSQFSTQGTSKNLSNKEITIKDANIFVENEGYFYSSAQYRSSRTVHNNNIQQRCLNIILKNNSKVYFIQENFLDKDKMSDMLKILASSPSIALESNISLPRFEIPKELEPQMQVLNPSFIRKNLSEYRDQTNFQNIIPRIISLRNKICTWNWSQREMFMSNFLNGIECLESEDPIINAHQQTNQTQSSTSKSIGTNLLKIGSDSRQCISSYLDFSDLFHLHRTCKFVMNERNSYKIQMSEAQSWKYMYLAFISRGSKVNFEVMF